MKGGMSFYVDGIDKNYTLKQVKDTYLSFIKQEMKEGNYNNGVHSSIRGVAFASTKVRNPYSFDSSTVDPLRPISGTNKIKRVPRGDKDGKSTSEENGHTPIIVVAGTILSMTLLLLLAYLLVTRWT